MKLISFNKNLERSKQFNFNSSFDNFYNFFAFLMIFYKYILKDALEFEMEWTNHNTAYHIRLSFFAQTCLCFDSSHLINRVKPKKLNCLNQEV